MVDHVVTIFIDSFNIVLHAIDKNLLIHEICLQLSLCVSAFNETTQGTV